MNDDVRGLAGDRRRNPFPSLNDTEFELLRATIREDVQTGVHAGMTEFKKDNCADHQNRTRALEVAVFGSRESGIVGMDENVARHERELSELSDNIKWGKRLVYGAFVTGVVAIIVATIQVIVLGR